MTGRAAAAVLLLLLTAAAPPTSLLPAALTPPPVWEARPVEADARAVAERSYRVAPGDGLLQVAVKTGASAEVIARANGLTRPYSLRIGQTLRIPGGRYHLVRAGQSGIAIARAYGLDWARIVAANALPEPYVLRAGQRILIPEPASEGTRSRAAERAAAFSLDIDDIVTGGQPALPAKPKAPRLAAARPDRPLPPAVAVVPPPRLTGNGFVWPVRGAVVKRFGRGATGDRSDGIKVAVPLGTPVRATADGVVAYAGSGIAALGGLIIMRHGSGWTSVYGHTAKLLVTRGQAVKRGQTIALSGDTGFADRPELHFELRKNRSPVDPVGLLRRE